MNPFRILICAIFAIAVLAAPWPIGGNWPFARTCILIIGLAVLVVAILDRKPKRPLSRFPLIWIPLALGAAFVWFQSSSLSGGLYQSFGSPRPFAESMDVSATAISLYPAASREKLVDLLMGLGLFFAATVLLRDRKTIIPVMLALVIVGAALSFFGVIQSLSWNGKIFWSYELLFGGRSFASFVNKNNAAGFLVITFSAALFFFAYQLFTWKSIREPAGLVLAEDHWERETESKKAFVTACVDAFSKIQPKHLYCGAAIAAIFGAVFVSLSRGGMIAIAGAGVVAVVLVSRGNKWLVAFLVLCLVGTATGFIVISDENNMVAGQLETLTEIDSQSTPRLLHWQDALPFAQKNLALGTGAGTYRYTSNSFQTFFFQRSYAHAESVFIETLVEMGILGIALLLLVILAATVCSFKLYRRNEPFDCSLGACGLICLAGVSIASALDFGLYQPANITAMAILMGCIVGRASTDLARPNTNAPKKSFLSVAVPICLITMVLACSWATFESFGIESRKRASRNLALINEFKTPQSSLTSRASLHKTKKLLERAVKIRPDDSEAHFLMGEYHLVRYRCEAATKLNDQISAEIEADTSENPPEKPEIEAVWTMTAPASVHREYKYALRSNKAFAHTIANDEHIQAHWPKAWEEYQIAEALCPYLSKTQYRLAELSAFFDPESESEHIDETLQRTHLNTKMMFSCGLLALNSGDQPKAVELWSKCLANPNSKPYEATIVEICQSELPMKAFFEEVLPQSPAQLIHVAKKYFLPPDMMLPKRLLLVHTKRVIEKAELSDLERNFFSAEACRMSDEFKPAAEFYRKALELDPKQVSWRLNYAKCLHQNKEYDEAIRQAKLCEVESTSIRSKIKPLLAKIRRDRAQRQNR